jgi:hypothetical protein
VWVGLGPAQTQAEYSQKPLQVLETKTRQALHALVEPVAYDQWLTISTAAVHPEWLLALALVGSLTGVRRALFLWAGFLGGLAPAILGYSPLPSTRRMLMAFPFIALAASCALDVVPWRRLRAALSAALILVTGVWSVRYYFSDAFFPPWSRWVFDADRTAVLEALPTPLDRRLIFAPSLGYTYAARSWYDTQSQSLHASNFFPPLEGDVLYAFDQNFRPLQPLYLAAFGSRVQIFGGGFLVALEKGDWSWLRRYGWAYQTLCQGHARSAQLPALFQVKFTFPELHCATPIVHTWIGRWRGGAAQLRMRYTGKLKVTSERATLLEGDGWEAQGDFRAEPDDLLTLTLEVPVGAPVLAALTEVIPSGERAPLLSSITPP